MIVTGPRIGFGAGASQNDSASMMYAIVRISIRRSSHRTLLQIATLRRRSVHQERKSYSSFYLAIGRELALAGATPQRAGSAEARRQESTARGMSLRAFPTAELS